MSVFDKGGFTVSSNFNNEDNNKSNEEWFCNCSDCSHKETVELAKVLAELAAEEASNKEELTKEDVQDFMFEVLEEGKIIGVKEYLHDTAMTQLDMLDILNKATSGTVTNEESDEDLQSLVDEIEKQDSEGHEDDGVNGFELTGFELNTNFTFENDVPDIDDILEKRKWKNF